MFSCITVVGGLNVDIGGFSGAALVDNDSNPGSVIMSLGGVGRNIAHNLCLLNIPVQLVSVVGNDSNGAMIWSACESIGMEMSMTKTVFGANTSTYPYIADHNRDMRLAISDMDIYNYITPGYLEKHMRRINQGCAVVVDANIPEESILYLAQHATVPVIADPVSGAKAPRMIKALPYITCIKPNALEAGIMTGIDTADEEGVRKAAKRLVEMGAKNVLISRGDKGVCCANAEELFIRAAAKANVVNTTGAGDAFTAGICLGMLQKRSLPDICMLAQAAASIALESRDTVSPDMCLSGLIQRYEDMKTQL